MFQLSLLALVVEPQIAKYVDNVLSLLSEATLHAIWNLGVPQTTSEVTLRTVAIIGDLHLRHHIHFRAHAP